MKIHERLKNYRQSKGVKQSYIAEKTGKTKQRISALENGHTKLTADEFEEICRKGLEINPAIFFDEQGLDAKTN